MGTSEEVYEVISMAMRYWFVFLGALIVWRSFSWLRKDRAAKHRKLRRLPDAGMIGEMVVLRGSDELPEGKVIPMPYEGTLGFVRSCDVAVPVDQVAGCHLDFSFQPHLGLLIYLRRGQKCAVDGVAMDHRAKPRQWPMLHGSVLEVGGAALQLRLFAELDTMRPRKAKKQTAKPQSTLFGQPVAQKSAKPQPAKSVGSTLFGQPLSDTQKQKTAGQRRRSDGE